VVAALLAKGAEVNRASKDGRTALSRAKNKRRATIVAMLTANTATSGIGQYEERRRAVRRYLARRYSQHLYRRGLDTSTTVV
jgi:predicted secreted Zn-dependent protease